jgi:hypothetical protein
MVKWFLAIYLITSAKNDIAALELARQLGVKWDTAWLIKQKLMEVMRQRNASYKLEGDVQTTAMTKGTLLAAPRPAFPGFSPPKYASSMATRKNKPIYTQLRCVPGFTKEAIKAYAEANIAPGARVVSDGLGARIDCLAFRSIPNRSDRSFRFGLSSPGTHSHRSRR